SRASATRRDRRRHRPSWTGCWSRRAAEADAAEAELTRPEFQAERGGRPHYADETASFAPGNQIRTTTPPPSRLPTSSVPPCASTISRHSVSPSPVPFAFVE